MAEGIVYVFSVLYLVSCFWWWEERHYGSDDVEWLALKSFIWPYFCLKGE